VKENDMHAIAARKGAALRFAVVLLVLLGATGCNKEKQGEKMKVVFSFDCGDKTVTVDVAPNFVSPDPVYVCEGDVVTWEPADDVRVKTFEVEFKNDFPFDGPAKKFHKDDRKSEKTKKQKPGLTYYPYKITVNGQVYDPQVVGGGN
jgi:hypothetical protein